MRARRGLTSGGVRTRGSLRHSLTAHTGAPIPLRLLILALSGLLLGCPARSGGGGDDAASAVGDDADATADDRPIIPDPGTAMDDWGNEEWGKDGGCCSSPETAYPVGTVTMDAGYIQGFFEDDFEFFYVFRAGDELTEFTFPAWFEEVHLHEGTDLRFGDLVDPSSTQESSVTWDVSPGAIYVVELISDFEGFF